MGLASLRAWLAQRLALSVDALEQSHSGAVWIGRFAAHLKGLLPSMNFIAAVQNAVRTWPYACRIEPEEAADIFHVRFLQKAVQQPESAVRHGHARDSSAALEIT